MGVGYIYATCTASWCSHVGCHGVYSICAVRAASRYSCPLYKALVDVLPLEVPLDPLHRSRHTALLSHRYMLQVRCLANPFEPVRGWCIRRTTTNSSITCAIATAPQTMNKTHIRGTLGISVMTLSVYGSVHLSICLSLHLPCYPFAGTCACVCISVSVHLSARLSVWGPSVRPVSPVRPVRPVCPSRLSADVHACARVTRHAVHITQRIHGLIRLSVRHNCRAGHATKRLAYLWARHVDPTEYRIR